MTGLAIVCAPSAVAIASDGACHEIGGPIVRFDSKVLLVPEWFTVLACRGEPRGLHYIKLMATLAHVDGFDALRDRIAGIAEDAFNACVADGHTTNPHFTLAAAGWSVRSNRFEAFRVSSRPRDIMQPADETSVELPPWNPLPINGLWSAPWPGDDAARSSGVFALRGDARSSLRCVKLLLIAARINQATIDGCDENGYWVGGFLQLTLLTRNFVATWIDRRWPDKIGQRIQPDPAEFEQTLQKGSKRAWPRGLQP